MNDLLTMTGTTSNADLYKHIKNLENYGMTTEAKTMELKNQQEVLKSLNQFYNANPNTLLVDRSQKMKDSVKNGDILMEKDKVSLLLLGSSVKVMDYLQFDTHMPANEVMEKALQSNGWTKMIAVVARQDIQNEMIAETLSTLTSVGKYLEKEMLDIIVAGNDKVVSLREQGFNPSDNDRWMLREMALNSEDSPTQDFVFGQHKEHALHHQQKSITDVKGYQEFVDYYASQEIKGLNYIHDKERIEELMAISHNHRYDERFSVVMLDKQGDAIAFSVINEGSENQVEISPSKLARTILNEPHAEYVALYHNHPSGTVEPSLADIKFTNHVHEMLELFKKPLIDHSIVAKSNTVQSFRHEVPDMQASYQRLEKEMMRQAEMVM